MTTARRKRSKKVARKPGRPAASVSARQPPDLQRPAVPPVERESIEDPLEDWPEGEAEADVLGIERPAPDIERDEN